MDRSYLAPHRVRVFAKPGDAEPLRTLQIVPHKHQGLDNYMVDGVMYPGYFDGNDQEAKVFLSVPFFKGARA